MAGRKAAGKRREVLASGWDRVRGCSTLAQLLFAYARTGHQSPIVPGIGRWSMALAAEHLGSDVAAVRSAIAELTAREELFVDEAMGVVFIPFGCREGTPATKHYVTSWVHPLADIPACELKTRALRILAAICAEKGPEFAAELAAIGGAPPMDPPSTPPVHPPSTQGAPGVDHHVTGLGSPGAGDRVQGAGPMPAPTERANLIARLVRDEAGSVLDRADDSAIATASIKIDHKLATLATADVWSDLEAEIRSWVQHVIASREDARTKGVHWTTDRTLIELDKKASSRIRYRPGDARTERDRPRRSLGKGADTSAIVIDDVTERQIALEASNRDRQQRAEYDRDGRHGETFEAFATRRRAEEADKRVAAKEAAARGRKSGGESRFADLAAGVLANTGTDGRGQR